MTTTQTTQTHKNIISKVKETNLQTLKNLIYVKDNIIYTPNEIDLSAYSKQLGRKLQPVEIYSLLSLNEVIRKFNQIGKTYDLTFDQIYNLYSKTYDLTFDQICNLDK